MVDRSDQRSKKGYNTKKVSAERGSLTKPVEELSDVEHTFTPCIMQKVRSEQANRGSHVFT